jgi:hypothetical protein
MTKALPNIQQITKGNLGFGQKYYDGEESEMSRTNSPLTTSRATSQLYNALRSCAPWSFMMSHLNGRYAFLLDIDH